MADMPYLDALPTLTDRPRQAVPKPAPILMDRIAAQRALAQAWIACVRIVDARDRFRCRCCGRHVKRTLTLCPERAEHHHLASKATTPALTTDARNVLCVCAWCHLRLTRHELVVLGLAADMFTVNGRAYLNANGPLIFRPSVSQPHEHSP